MEVLSLQDQVILVFHEVGFVDESVLMLYNMVIELITILRSPIAVSAVLVNPKQVLALTRKPLIYH